MDIEAARSLPEMAGLDDQQIVDAIHQAYYPDLPREEVASSLGIKPPPTPRPTATFGDRIKDVGLSALQGAVAVPEAAVGLADLVTGGAAGRGAEALGFRPEEASKELQDALSPAQQYANKQVQDAEGFWGTFKAAVTNPSTVFQSVVQSLPSMGAGGVIGRGMMASRMTPGMLARLSAMTPEARDAAVLGMQTTAGAVGEGAVQSGQAAEQARTDNPLGDLDGKGTLGAVASGVGDTIIARFSGRLANKLGIADADTMLAGAAVNPRAAKHVVKASLEGMVTEGLLEELPQSIQEQVWQNYAAGKPLDEGVNQAAVLGMLSGASMGAGANVLNALRHPAKPTADDVLAAPDVDTAIKTAMQAVQPVASEAPAAMPGAIAPSLTGTDAADLMGRSDPFMDAVRGPRTATGTPHADLLANQPVDPLQAPAREDAAARNDQLQADLAGQAVDRMRRAAEDDANAQRDRRPLLLPRKQPAAPALDTAIQPGDILDKAGAPFKELAATLKAKSIGGTIVPVQGGFIVRPNKETQNADDGNARPSGDAAGRPAAAAGNAAATGNADDVRANLLGANVAAPVADGARRAQAVSPAEPAAQAVGGAPLDRDGNQASAQAGATVGAAASGQVVGAENDSPVRAPARQGDRNKNVDERVGAAKQTSERKLTEAGAQWTRMTEAERRAVAGRTAGKAKALDRLVAQPWEALASGWQRSLARVMGMAPENVSRNPAAAGQNVTKSLSEKENSDSSATAGRETNSTVQSASSTAENKDATNSSAVPVRDATGDRGGRVLPGVQERETAGMAGGQPADARAADEGREPKLRQDGAPARPADAEAVRNTGVQQDGRGDASRRLQLPAARGVAVPGAPSGAPSQGVSADGARARGAGTPNGETQGTGTQPVSRVAEPSGNKVFTDDMAEKARARLKAKLGRAGAGIDPEMMLDGITLAGYHIEKGARSFAAYAKAMLADLGEGARAHLKGWYMGVKYSPQAADFAKEMSSAAFVDEFDLSHVAAPSDTTSLESKPPAADTGEDHASSTALNLDRSGAGPLEGAPAADVRAPAESGNAGHDAGQRGDGDQRGDARADGPGGQLAGSVGANPRAVPVSPGGAAGAAQPAAKLRLPRSARTDAGPGLFDDAGREGGLTASSAPNAAPVTPPQFKLEDFTIDDDLALGEGGQKTKFKNNIAALRVLRELGETENAPGGERPATPQEQQVLAKYVGWGGLAQAFDARNADWAKEYAELKDLLPEADYEAARQSTRYAHYTSREVIQDGVYAALRHFGFTGGRVLEGGAGVGNFIGLMPQDMRSAGRVTAIEREPVAAAIAKNLYPLQNVQQADFTEFKGADGYFDAVVGNPPFAADPQVDRSGRKHLSGLSLHNYFFAKEVDMLREGGILAQVVTNYFLDAQNERARRYIGDRTKLLGAIRLPNNAFSKNAGTEVTTDLIFLQKLPEAEWSTKATRAASKAWLTAGKWAGKNVNLNQYFQDHPHMMLGDFGPYGTMYGGGEAALVARPGQDTAALLREAVQKLPQAVYVDRSVIGTNSAIENATKALPNPPVQEGGYYLDGSTLTQRLPDIAGEARGRDITANTQWTAKTKLGDSGYDKLVRLADMRQTLRDLLAAELAGNPAMQALRKTLNTQYDGYTKEHGLLGDAATARVFDDDPDFPLLLSLEHNYTPGIGLAAAKAQGIKPTKSTATKAPIFNQRVVDARKQVQKVETPADALAVSMAERGKLDTAYIGKLLNKDPQEMLKELSTGEKPLLFLDPATDEYVLRDAYLSGNVRAKLQQAEQSGLSANARALEAVQPEDVGAHEISARIGSPWVPTDVYEDFAKELFGDGTKASIRYIKLNSSYSVYVHGASEVNTTNKWGTPLYSGPELLSALLNNRAIKVMNPPDHEGHRSVNVEATDMANTKAQEIRDRFQDWLFSEPQRSELLTRTYNDTNNNYVTRTYNGAFMTFPGKVPDSVIKFRRHQRDAIARIVQDRTTLLDHVVGAGKTYTIVAAAMELRRTGLARKPLVAVPNHLVKQWAADFYRLYPGANILTATKKDFEKVNRRRFLAKIATGDWDAVVIAHSSFGFIKPGAEFEAEFNDRQVSLIMQTIEAVKDGDGDKGQKRRTVKQLEAMKERLQNRIRSLREKAMDDLLDFEQLGVDQLFVDEAHMFKNLMFTTKMQGVQGLGDSKGSQRAYDMYVKSQEVIEKNGRGQGLVFATGTPVSNSLAEKYHMMRYLMPKQMEELGFQSFDAWANTFASVEQVWMQKFSGDGYKASNRMSNFVNVHELLKMFDQVADTVTLDDIKKAYKEENDGKDFPIPPVKTGRRQPVSLEKSAAQTAYMEDIARRAKILEARKGPPRKGEDNALVIMGDARKAAMDIRLVEPGIVQREPGGRIDDAAGKIMDRYQKWHHVKGTQIVFSDLGTPKKHAAAQLKEYEELKTRIDAATDQVRERAAFGAEDAQAIVDDAEDAQAEMEAQGQDWLTAVKAALRGFSVYDDLKDALIERGIPENEIAFIHDYNTDDRKAALFRKVNAGDIRVVVGSTAKMGAGTNVQERLVAEHHLDVPWRPSDVEQREGRIERQGNLLLEIVPNFEVEILAYVTKDTLDMRMWQIQEVKLKMIHQLRTRQIERNIDNAFEDMEMSAGEMQAAATGNMDLLREIQAKSDIKKLEQKRRSFDAQKSDLVNRRRRVGERLAQLPAQIKQAEVLAEGSDLYDKALADSTAQFKVTIDGKEYADRHEAGQVLLAAIDAKLYVRTAEKDGKKVREEMSSAAHAALAKKVQDMRAAGTTGAPLDEAVHELTSWDEKAAPIDINLNGENFTARAKLQEAWSNATGDRSPIVWQYEGAAYTRRALLTAAMRQAVADSIADEKEVSLGTIGPFAVTVEGQSVKQLGEMVKVLDVVLGYKGQTMEGQIHVSATEEPEKVAEQIVNWADRKASSAASDLVYYKRELENAQRQDTELKAADDMGAWPDQAKLDEARARHQAILKRMGGQNNADGTPAGDGAMMGQGDKTGGMSAALVQHAADTVASVWENAPNIVALPSIANAPAKVRDDARERMARGGGTPKAVFYKGTVYLFADALHSPAEAVEYAYHEVLGHYGMQGKFGLELDKELKAIATLRKEEIDKMYARTGKERSPAMDIRMAEEVVAYMAQKRPDLSFIQRVVAAIKNFLRDHVPGFDSLNMSDHDIIQKFVLPARQYVEGGGPTGGGEMAPAFGSATAPFYSALSRTLAANPANALPPVGWAGAIQAAANKGAVKADEVQWSGVDDWLKMQQGKVPKDAVLAYLDQNGVRVTEVHKGGGADRQEEMNGLMMQADALGFTVRHDALDDYMVVMVRNRDDKTFRALLDGTLVAGYDGNGERLTGGAIQPIAARMAAITAAAEDGEETSPDGTKHGRYTLPGGTNYREVLLTLPAVRGALTDDQQSRLEYLQHRKTSGAFDMQRGPLAEELTRLESIAHSTEYKSTHWSEPNVLAHIRLNDRTDTDGKRVLFVEEIQSDWAQQGKKIGFAEKPSPNDTPGEARFKQSGIPVAPFVGKTDAWVSLALKRVIKMAVDEGYDKVAFVNGEQSADRYDLSKQIASVQYLDKNSGGIGKADLDGEPGSGHLIARDHSQKRVIDQFVNDQAKIEEYVGKDVAKKLLQAEAKHVREAGIGFRGREVSGLDLKVGGEGMKAFYDKIVPNVANDVLKKIGGGKLGEVTIEGRNSGGISGADAMRRRGIPEAEQNAYWNSLAPLERDSMIEALREFRLQQPGFDITPAMRKTAGDGLPMFNQAKGFNTRQIQVNGKWMPIETSSGELIAPTFQGQSEFWKKHADAFELDDKGRPKATPDQIKALLGNTDGDAMFAQADDAAPNDPRAYWSAAKDAVRELGNTPGKLHWWHKTVGTMYNLSKRSKAFKAVFDRVQDFLNDVSVYATEAADLAPNILPKLETWRDMLKTPLSGKDTKAISAPIFEGTLAWARVDGNPVRVDDLEKMAENMGVDDMAQMLLHNDKIPAQVLTMWRGLPQDQYQQAVATSFKNRMLRPGIVWTDKELKSQFGLTAEQAGYYKEFRKAVDQSITSLAISDMVRYAGDDAKDVRADVLASGDVGAAAAMLRAHLMDKIEQNPAREEVLTNTINKLQEKMARALQLQEEGYAPLTRFGHYTVDVVGKDGERLYFGMAESRFEAERIAKRLQEEFPTATVTRGTMSQEDYKLFAGVSPETIELFGEMLGLETEGTGAGDKAFQEYLKLAKNTRSSMKRLIHRKGIAGFSEDTGRVLAGFIYSNARQTSRNLHMGEIDDAVNAVDKRQGELRDTAMRLADYIKNPVEEAHALRGLLFAQYLGGNVASALVNMTQPFQVTMPYLSQWVGVTGAARQMKDALKVAWADSTGEKTLDTALKKATEQGIVAPQEVHQLIAQAHGSGGLKSGDGTRVGDAAAAANNGLVRLQLGWGKFFSTAELFNRRVTFVAAYRVAVEKGMADPYDFAVQAVDATQFVYNKGNKPAWARGAIGSTLFTFKQYSISYLELMQRMATAGEPGSAERAAGQRAAMFAMAMILLMGGAGGLPFADDVGDIVDGLMQRLGFNWSTKQKRQELFDSAFGKGFGHVLEKGVSGLPGVPIDVAGRFGMGNLVPGTGLFVKKTDHTKDVAELAGPVGDLASRAFGAADLAASGRGIDAGMALAPTAAQNLAKAIDMASTGKYKDQRGYKVLDTDAYDAAAKAIGFQPNDVARVQEADSTAQGMVARVRLREGEIAAQWAKAISEGDQDGAREAREEIAAWNDKNPDTPIRIKLGDVLKRAKLMNEDRATRIEKSAPKEVRKAAGDMLRAGREE